MVPRNSKKDRSLVSIAPSMFEVIVFFVVSLFILLYVGWYDWIKPAQSNTANEIITIIIIL